MSKVFQWMNGVSTDSRIFAWKVLVTPPGTRGECHSHENWPHVFCAQPSQLPGGSREMRIMYIARIAGAWNGFLTDWREEEKEDNDGAEWTCELSEPNTRKLKRTTESGHDATTAH